MWYVFDSYFSPFLLTLECVNCNCNWTTLFWFDLTDDDAVATSLHYYPWPSHYYSEPRSSFCFWFYSEHQQPRIYRKLSSAQRIWQSYPARVWFTRMVLMAQYGVRYGGFLGPSILCGEQLLEWHWEPGLVLFPFHWIGVFPSPMISNQLLLVPYWLSGVTDAFVS